jgi:hypothetical protein
MLYTIAVVLIVLWLLGLVTSYTMGGFIHVLLVIAVIMILVNVIQGRRPCKKRLMKARKRRFDEYKNDCNDTDRLGIVVLAYSGITYKTRGNPSMSSECTWRRLAATSFPPVAGALALVGGIVLLAACAGHCSVGQT